MDTGIKMLLKAERENWKKCMVKETKGTYIAIYLGLIFSVFMSLMFGFKYDYSSDDKRVIISLIVYICCISGCDFICVICERKRKECQYI